MNKNLININNLENETKSIKNGFRLKPTVFNMLTFISDGNKAAKIEELIINEYKSKIKNNIKKEVV